MDGTSGSQSSIRRIDATATDSVAFSDLLRRLRLRSGFTQADLAERAGLSERGISDLERGVRRSPHKTTLELLAGALTLSAAERASLFRAARPRQRPHLALRDDLPAPLTSFVGRRRERDVLGQQVLSDDTRLLILTGAAGVGKTRLAIEIAREIRDRFEDGACFVGLASVASADGVRDAVFRAVDGRDGGGRPAPGDPIAHLRHRHMLLILDNFEHVTDAVPVIGDLLTECPGLKIVVTSRVAPRLPGERIHEVSPLSLPDGGPLPARDRIDASRSSEAVQLFVQRASAHSSQFALTEQNVDAIAGICCRLDGLPLAIELAAARIRVLSPQEILANLQQPLDVLGGEQWKTSSTRHTLRETLAWSDNLLGEGERMLFARLAVFAGNCDLEAIEAVCATDGGAACDVIEQLSVLVDSSLVRSREDARTGRRRFGMLNTVRAYALERLRDDPGELERIRRRHAVYYLSLAERAASELLGPDQGDWYGVLELEHPNLREALTWAREQRQADTGLRLAAALWRSWEARGQAEEGLAWFETFLPMADDVSEQVRAEALNGAALLACARGRYAAAEAFLEEGLRLSEAVGDRDGLARACNSFGVVAMRRGDYARAEALQERSLALTSERGDVHRYAIVAGNLGITRMYQGNLAGSERILRDNLRRSRELGLAQEVADTLTFLGFAALYGGNFAEAHDLMIEGRDVARESGNVVCTIESTRGAGCALLAMGRADEAGDVLSEALELASRGGDVRRVVRVLDAYGCVLAERGHSERAARLWSAAGQARGELGIVEHPVERDFHDAWRSQAAVVAGAAMSVGEAVICALESPT